ncbi:MAG: hypothetical protein HYV63_14960 [Candidatus Schekmanbacteria bacterium]|nr:hypothetical protein [Candidatus Schekmanbacteria bacterium]
MSAPINETDRPHPSYFPATDATGDAAAPEEARAQEAETAEAQYDDQQEDKKDDVADDGQRDAEKRYAQRETAKSSARAARSGGAVSIGGAPASKRPAGNAPAPAPAAAQGPAPARRSPAPTRPAPPSAPLEKAAELASKASGFRQRAYQDIYNYLRENGVPDHKAKQQAAMMALQAEQQFQNQLIQLMTTLLKNQHETMKAIIRNLRV